MKYILHGYPGCRKINKRNDNKMTKRDILALACKIFGIYFFMVALETLQTIGVTISSLSQMPELQRNGYLIGSVIPFLLLILGSLSLIKCSTQISKWLAGNDKKIEGVEKHENISEDTLQKIIFSGIGIFMIANSLPRITQIIISIIVQPSINRGIGLNTWISIFNFLVQLSIGVYLFFGSKALIQLVRKFRS
jgi:hypothetical protein